MLNEIESYALAYLTQKIDAMLEGTIAIDHQLVKAYRELVAKGK